MQKFLIAVVATAVIAGGGAFYGGMQYERGHATPAADVGTSTRRGGAGMNGGGRRGVFGDAVIGDVIAKDARTITVKLRDGGSRIVLVTNQTQVVKSTAGAASDLVIGAHLIANGSANDDGSMTARMVQIRPKGLDLPDLRGSRAPAP